MDNNLKGWADRKAIVRLAVKARLDGRYDEAKEYETKAQAMLVALVENGTTLTNQESYGLLVN